MHRQDSLGIMKNPVKTIYMHNGSLDKSNNGYRRIPIRLKCMPCNIVIVYRMIFLKLSHMSVQNNLNVAADISTK